ncbi:hypothetical protein H634G_09837 [Metarhizium anisopliae BRIP 53293]|uniref:C5a peptidase/Subtilisin-like protease SBT2-like Fn3-like domain-containing protein n=1 Tax=Metarhizium anisopliae BRIP 53293 TaxID=1291518 RepID=A0A0D9NM02_METAN|nr:hypothetical protein H634G_09837 [Metarhizium anisopliae BRIP 53293]KJK86831.1 hypothetical protein H633G_09325 [Metarhizium anisopliae BRIP 53284]
MSLLEPSSSSATARAFVAGSDANYLGVAPNATLAGYRVLDCSAMLEEDDLIAGWVKAYQDGAQIIVSSAGWPGAAWATRPAAAVVSRIVDSGVPCIVGLGNENNSGLFNTLNPSSGRGVTSVNAVKVTYHLDTLAAKTIYTLVNGGGRVQRLDPPVDESAHVKLSRRLLVLGPGESASVDISATDPKGLDPKRLPVWSGWISIQSSSKCSNSSSVLTVPYLGVSGSMKEHQVLQPDRVVLSTLFDNGRDEVHPDEYWVDYETKNDSSVSIDLPVRIKPDLGTRLVRAEVVPLSPRKWLAARLADKNLKLDAFSLEALAHAYATRKPWSGRLESGDYIPAGKYNLVVRALRLFGDAAVASDWDLSENVSFEIIKPAGRKACERSASRFMVTRWWTPWVPAPQDKALRDRCVNGELTDEFCGTYELCRKHRDIELLSDVKSPFTSLTSCIKSHKTLPFKPFDYSRIQECMANQDDESICGTDLWCNLQYGSPQPTDEYGSSEECRWAHGSYR